MFDKKNLPLVFAFLIPILMVLFVALSVYLPGLFLKPKYNFIYSTNDGYYGDQAYKVTNGHLTEVPTPTPSRYYNPQKRDVKLYLHNMEENVSAPISFQDATVYSLDSNAESPDGYSIERASGYGIFPFAGYSRDYDSRYLVGNSLSKKLNLKKATPPYSDSIHFLGWITK